MLGGAQLKKLALMGRTNLIRKLEKELYEKRRQVSRIEPTAGTSVLTEMSLSVRKRSRPGNRMNCSPTLLKFCPNLYRALSRNLGHPSHASRIAFTIGRSVRGGPDTHGVEPSSPKSSINGYKGSNSENNLTIGSMEDKM